MKTVMTIPITQTVYDFWDMTIPLVEDGDVSEVGFKVNSDVIEVQVPDGELEAALKVLEEVDSTGY
jgi:hypothetical protein